MSISTLNDDLNILQNLAIPGFEEDVDVIQKLDDEPNDVGGLTAAELKAKFDEAGNRIKTYLNETLIPSISETVAEAEKRAEAEAARVLAEEQRAAAEQERVAAEAEREQAEAERRAGEAARVSAEEERDAAETARKESEAARALAEQNRVDTDNGIVAQATKAAEDAETAKDNAEKAAETASSAAIHQPIVGDNQNWWTWNIAAGDYVDTGIYAAGHSPYIGNNGNWWIGAEDTGVAATGPQGPQGIQGIQGQAGLAGSDGQDGADGKSAYQYAVEGGYTGTEAEFAEKLAQEMPDKLPNPNALTFTGAVTGSYDGSEALTVEIPSGGSGGGTSSETADIPVTAEKAFSASVLELNHVSDNQYVAQHDSVLFEATEDTTLSVGNDNMIGSPYSANVGMLTMATVAYTEIENGYALDYADDYTGLKAFMNQRFGFNANIKSGRTYTIRFYVNAASVGNVYLYLVNEKTEPGTLVGGGNIRTGTVCQITFTADADYTFVRIPIQTLPAEITKITLCEGDVPLEYGNGAESYALLAGEKVWLSGVWNLNCVGIGKFYESPLALTSLNGIPTQNGAINSCATNKVWVNMGDSIWTFGASTGGIGTITDYMLALCGGTWHNIATGGTTMASRPGDYAGTYDALDFWKLADAVVAGDYTDAKAAAAELTSNFANIDSIDWAAVNYITVAYGTNDIDFGAGIDNESNLFDTATICGALRYGIKAINSAYPNIRFKVLGLLYRNADSVSMAKIVECNNALKDAAAYVGAEFIDGYGINEGNRSTYLYDGTHPNGEGKQRIAETLARNIHDIWY